MNYHILFAGILAAMAAFGHLTAGRKLYLKPLMNSDLDEVPKRIMLSLFHYMSVFQVMSTLVLLAGCGEQCMMYENVHDVVKFIGFNYALFAIVQFIIGAASPVKNGVLKMFQWMFWAFISTFALLGVL